MPPKKTQRSGGKSSKGGQVPTSKTKATATHASSATTNSSPSSSSKPKPLTLPSAATHIPLKDIHEDFRGPEGKEPFKSGFVTVPALPLKASSSSKSNEETTGEGKKQAPHQQQHQLRYKVYGNPSGIPAVFVHGGPGYHSQYDDRCHFNPALYQVVLYDQRGCGESLPRCHELQCFLDFETLTVDRMVDDMDCVRRAVFGASAQWVVLGVSWGSGLALRYAESPKYGRHVSNLILQGIYTGSVDEHAPLFAQLPKKDTGSLPSPHSGDKEQREGGHSLAVQDPQVMHQTARAHLLEALQLDTDGVDADDHALLLDPLRLHRHAADIIRRGAVAGPSTAVKAEEGRTWVAAQRLLAAWEQYENYMTYPAERQAYLKALAHTVEVTKPADSNPPVFKAAFDDATQTMMQLILFPQMMTLQPPLCPSRHTIQSLRQDQLSHPTVPKPEQSTTTSTNVTMTIAPSSADALKLNFEWGGIDGIPVALPITIIHGTADDVCPVWAADTLYLAILASRRRHPQGKGKPSRVTMRGTSGVDDAEGGGLKYYRVKGAGHESDENDYQIHHWLIEATNAAWEQCF